MTIARLRYFVVVAAERSFVRAAARLHITQSALSQQIRRLEQEMGQELLIRTSRIVSLTDAGRALLPKARDVLRRYDHLPQLVSDAASAELEVIRIGAVPSAIIGLMPDLVADFRRIEPMTSLVVEEVSTPEQFERLRAGTLDVGISRSPEPPADFESVRLATDEYFVCLPDSHRLASRDLVPWSELRRERIIVPSREVGQAGFDMVVAACHSAGFSPDVVPVTVRGFHLMAWVAAGSGVAIIPAHVTRQSQVGTVIRAIDPRVPAVPLRLAAVRGTLIGTIGRLADLAMTIQPREPIAAETASLH